MNTLICGSIAYDTIMVFPDRFKNHILPDQMHILNVAFLVPDMRREFGGCAGNIAYNLKLLGGEPLIMATVGDDYRPYAYRLERLQLSQAHVREVPGHVHRAGLHHHRSRRQPDHRVPSRRDEPFAREPRRRRARRRRWASSRPTAARACMQHAREFDAAGIPFMFDPGPGPADVHRRGAARVHAPRRATSRSTTTKRKLLQERPAASSTSSRDW